MSQNISFNNVSYTLPETGEDSWGTAVTNYLVALSTAALSKAGGSFTLTADADFGANFGLKSIYFSGRSTPATAGQFRLGNTQAISWRNAANDANLDLLVNASNNLTWKNIFKIQNTGSGFTALDHDTQGLELESTAMNATSKYCPPIKFMCADTDIVTNNPRCIAYIATRTPGTVNSDTTAWGVLEFATLPGGEAAATMPTVRATIDQNGNFGVANLAGTGSRLVRASAAAGNLSATAADIVNADINASAAIAYSKLNLATSIVNADISASAAIAYSKLNLATSIVNADINASAAIDYSKLASLSSANILVGSAANVATSVAMTGDVTISNTGVTALASSLSGSKTIDGSLSVLGASTSPTSIGHTTQGIVLRSADTSLSTGDYFPPIRWEATDSTLATTNPKTTAWIAAKAVEDFTSNSSSGTQIEFATSQLNGGNSVTPTVRMTIGSQGVVTVNEGIILSDEAGQDTLDFYDTQTITGASFATNNSGTGATYSANITRVGKQVTINFVMTIGSGPGTGNSISAAGVIESAFRPSESTINVINARSTAGATYNFLQVNSAGTFTFTTYNYAGTAQTHASANLVISYNVA